MALLLVLLISGCSTSAAPPADPRQLSGPATAQLAATSVSPVGGDEQPKLPARLKDVQGNDVVVHDISRILALDLYGTTARLVFQFGLGDKVVGRDTSSRFKEILDRPLVTPVGHELSAEAILHLAPTLIITDTSLGPWAIIEQLKEAGVTVVVVDSKRSMENVCTIIGQVGAALGMPATAATLAESTQHEINTALAAIKMISPSQPVRIAFLYLRGQSGIYYLFGKGSGADSLIQALGALDVATEAGVTGMKPMTDEAMIAARPDVLLVMTKGLESVGGVDGLLTKLPAFAQTPAGKQRRIVDMADTEILSFGTATPDVLTALATAIYGTKP